MKWIEAVINTKSEEIDVLCSQLEALGVEGISIEDEADFRQFLDQNRQYWDYVDDELSDQFRGLSRIKFYLSEDVQGKELLKTVQTVLHCEVKTKTVDSEDWENSWRQYYEPIKIGTRLLIVPDWLDPELENRVPLRLEPGLAFGTGGHATTQMCLEALDGMDLQGKTVLDLGCGSGILGVGALVLGCERVVACDVDPLAPEAARDNVGRNRIDASRFSAFAGDILSDMKTRNRIGTNYDIVLANIVSDVIIPLSSFARQFMAQNGVFICSGIIDSRAEEVKAALLQNGFEITEEKKKEEWFCFVCR